MLYSELYEIISKYYAMVNYKNMPLKLPKLLAYILHKILVIPLRNSEAKRDIIPDRH